MERPALSEPEQTEARELTVHEDVPLNALYLAFHMPGRKEAGYYEADVLTDILSTGTASRLHQRLVKETKAFVEADAYVSDSTDTGMFVIEGKISEGYDTAQAEALIWEEIVKLQQERIAEPELRKVKNKLLTYMNFSESSLLNRSIGLAYYEMLGDAGGINTEEAKYEAITPESLQQFAQRYLVRTRSNTLRYFKKN